MPVRGRSCFPLPEKGDGERSVVHKPEASAIPPLESVLFISSQTSGWARVGVCSYPQISRSLSFSLKCMHFTFYDIRTSATGSGLVASS